MTSWTIDNVSLEAAGVIALNFSFVNQSADVCTITLVDRGTPARQWERKTKVIIHRNGQLYFIGWVDDMGTRESAGDGGVEVTLKGPWFWLDEITFGRRLSAREGGGQTTSVQLFWADMQPVGLAAQVAEILNWASSASGGAFSAGQIVPSEAPETLPPEWVAGATCSDVVRRISPWAPDSVFWVSYGANPQINWTRPGARRTHALAKGAEPLESAQVYSDSGLAPSAVVIQYLGPKNEQTGRAGVVSIDAQPGGASVSTPGAAVFALEAGDDRRQDWARKLYFSARKFQWSGQITLANTMMEIKPGDMVRLSGRTEWAGSEAIVQTVQVMPDNDGITASLGAPKHLGVDSLQDLLWWMRSDTTREVVEPTLDLHPWQVYLTTAEETPFGREVRIAPGVVNFGSGPVKAKWKGRFLDNLETPFERFENGFSKQFYLRVVFIPDVERFSGTDTLGNEVNTYRALSTGTIRNVDVWDELQDSEAPFVDLRNGSTRRGVFWFALATVSEVGGELRVTQHQDKDLTALFNPPVRLFLL